jgi:putative transposase
MHLNPTVRDCWTPSGEQIRIESAGNDRKYQVFGSVDYRTGNIIFSQEERKRTAEYIAHIEQILSRYPDRPVILITDNYQIHKTKAVKELEHRHFGRLLQVYLPTYSPHLNPIEMLWRHIRRLVTHNYRFDTLAAVMQAVGLALEALSRQTEQVLSIIGGKPLAKAEAT